MPSKWGTKSSSRSTIVLFDDVLLPMAASIFSIMSGHLQMLQQDCYHCGTIHSNISMVPSSNTIDSGLPSFAKCTENAMNALWLGDVHADVFIIWLFVQGALKKGNWGSPQVLSIVVK
ncbi:hypothetical protein EDC04DRAFT_2612449 [Pisolithus marmoratus]|nr:hypothetical protein EDC04DRAFT_2612449 [Pisolithus marmoratus]